ncbi:FtsX-like permease family protein [bacterium]|uniref:Multidrug ABC transporter substrate-binding protein n=2 Tax=Katanobacteria TaxID=422282 RepID=A0A2M7X4H4_UNCKA|nr:FtsX-like permease family protein [bacterium]NCS96918.1 FtsX-like permease family protein [bacterium]PIP56600.1 MAG: hypothetical protein COX05_02185 [candidate division WWE3 bacterium CG22_combo_CG10-13_8_21_14_all_39_12]PJA41047.1 MAG: hypothetical protein CO179_00780 [candidate division WWE3 bacterium CG_4_9_14_3_um_filter_39_7]
MNNYIKAALLSFWNSKIRAILNLSGVIIGVTAVTTLVSLGEGLKVEVSGLIEGFGTNVVTIANGNIDLEGGASAGTMNPANFVATDIISLDDISDLEALDGIEQVAPVSLVPGKVTYADLQSSPIIMGVTGNFLQTFEVLVLKDGKMFDKNEKDAVAVVGPKTASALFGDKDPLGEKIFIQDTEFTIIGLSDEPKLSDLLGSEYSNIVLIPFSQATKLNGGELSISRTIVKATDTANVDETKDKMKALLIDNHGGEEDFTILTQDDLLGLFDDFVTLATTMVTAIAAISLLVGGIGIMNIMLVTVTERTREIGIRKAVGATKRDIMFQFLTEAVLITMIGGLLGLLLSFAIGAVVASQTPLTPSITPGIMILALGLSTLIGVIFGLWPAMRAASKDPIEALRYE